MGEQQHHCCYEEYNDYYSSVMENQKLMSLKTNRDGIEYILKNVRSLTLFRRDVYQMMDKHRQQHSKSEEKAMKYLKRGIKFHKSKKYKQAVYQFNNAILSAPFPGEKVVSNDPNGHLWRAFAYKSCSEFESGNYLSALSSVNHCLELYETNELLLHRIHCLSYLQRYTECLQYLDQLIQINSTDIEFKSELIEFRNTTEQMRSSDDSEEVLQQNVSSKTLAKDNVLKLWIHPGCELRKTERKGRHYMAKQFIQKGAIVMTEEAFSIELEVNVKTQFCSNCFKRIETSLWPCNRCDEVIFCDKQCFSQAFEKYHKYECGIFGALQELEVEKDFSFRHTFQMFSRAGIQKVLECEQRKNSFDFDRYWEEKRHQIENNDNNQSVNDYNLEFEAIYTLIGHKSGFIRYNFAAIVLVILFDYSRQLDFDIEKDFDKSLNFADICLKNLLRLSSNIFHWTKKGKDLGTSVCNLSSRINHSCDPNVDWSWHANKIVLKAEKDIKVGDEICITYGPTVYGESFKTRQSDLKYSYFFDCNCEACLRECKDFRCFRCVHCSGPVVYFCPVHFSDRDHYCLKCGQKFNDLETKLSKIKDLKTKFDEKIGLVSESNIQSSLIEAQNILKQLFELVYKESKTIKERFYRLLKVMIRHKRFAEAVQSIEFFGNIIDLKYDSIRDSKSISADILDELTLLTKCYFKYFNASQVLDTNQWNNCFQLYSKLIELLRMGKRIKRATDQKMKRVVPKIGSMIKQKEKELKNLKECFKSITNQI